ERVIWEELEKLKSEVIEENELTKVKNKTESLIAFANMSILDKAMNLAYFELLGNADFINQEEKQYQDVTVADIQRLSKEIFQKNNASTLIYLAAHQHAG